MKVKGILTAVLLIAAVLLSSVPALAADLDYSGPINSFTGEPADEAGVTGNVDLVPVASGIYFDKKTRDYVFPLGGSSGASISANVTDGMITNGVVIIKPSSGLEVRLYCNGSPVEGVDLRTVSQPGQYVLEARLSGEQYVRVMNFTIIGKTTGIISSYPMPAGFVITGVDLSVQDEKGEWVEAPAKWDRNSVSMSENGKYRVQYECARNGLSYTLETLIDHTPPTLELKNVVNGLAKGPVDISDLEDGCKIGITLNGGKMSYRDKLTLSGDYEIILQDEAGNHTRYNFTILVYFDASSWIFLGLVVLIIAGVGVYLYVSRKRMRVR